MIPSVYRCYDAEGALLYIGMSGDVTRRMIGHRTKTPWGRSVARLEITLHATRAEAFQVEAAEIAFHQPKWNALTVETQRPHKQKARVNLSSTRFGKKLQQVDAGMSLPAWADRFDISRSYIYGLFDGSRNPSLTVALKIEDATEGKIPVAWWPNHNAVKRAVAA